MRIALVILHADPARGGAERYTVDLAAGLASRNHDVTLVASSFAPYVNGQRHLLDVSALTRLGQYRAFIDRLTQEVIRPETYDLVHAMLPVLGCDLYHPHAGLAADAVVTGHEKYDGLRRAVAKVGNRLNRKRQYFADVERRSLDPSDPPVVLCLSEYIKSTIRKHYPALDDSKLATLFNAVDLNKFDPALRPEARSETRRRFNLTDERVVALIIAQDFQRKGLAEAILALPKDDPRLVLLVVGKPDPAQYQQLAAREGLADRVIFAGPTTDPYAFYKSADLFVLPTRHDPCSLVVLEALAMGLPVISTAYNGACEIMTDGTHGYVLPNPRDVDSLRDRYRQLLDPTRRQSMAAACLALRPRLSQEQHLDRLEAIYHATRR